MRFDVPDVNISIRSVSGKRNRLGVPVNALTEELKRAIGRMG